MDRLWSFCCNGKGIWGDDFVNQEINSVEPQRLFCNDTKLLPECFLLQVIRDSIRPQDLKLADLAQPPKMGHVQVGNKLM